MSVAGISASSWFTSQNVQNNFQQFRQEFQQLGQDLQSGNVSASQQDMTELQQLGSQTGATPSSQSSNPLTQDFTQLATNLKSGNLSAAHQDYSKIQQDSRSQSAQRHHHHHHGGGETSEASQLFSLLGQDLQSGNLTEAQQVYGTMQQLFPGLDPSSSTTSTPASSQSSASTLSVVA